MYSIAVRIAVGTALACGLAAAPLHAEEGRDFDPAVARRIKPEEVRRRQDAGEKVVLLDTRGGVGNLIAKGAVQLTNGGVEAWAKNVPKDALIVAYCT
jgi:hypothetical protein